MAVKALPCAPFATYVGSYSKMILSSTRDSVIAPVSTVAVDFTTSTERMLQTVWAAVATAWRAASDHEPGLVPTISRMMWSPWPPSRLVWARADAQAIGGKPRVSVKTRGSGRWRAAKAAVRPTIWGRRFGLGTSPD
jgi:hypothetical protein